MRTNLSSHTKRVHGLSIENARAVKSQTGSNHKSRERLPDDIRKTKRRHYERRQCPKPGCMKVVVRLDNHLRAARKITDDKGFGRLMRAATVYREFSESESSTDCEYLTTDSETDDEIKIIKKLYSNSEKKYLERVSGILVDSEDSSDDDWFENKWHEVVQTKHGKISLLQYHNMLKSVLI